MTPGAYGAKRAVRTLAAGGLLPVAITACGGGPVAVSSPSPLTGGLTQGLIGYVADQGVGGLDPATRKSTVVAPMPAGAAFPVPRPLWGPPPGAASPVLYFTIHDHPAPRRRTAPSVLP